MLNSSRKALLLDRLTRDGQLVVASLSAELGVSEDTLRRDLRELAVQGKLVRVHGGAVPASPTHVSLDRRRALHAEDKQGLAQVAADLIADGMIVLVDGGTTHMHIAAALPLTRRATVVTHSPGLAASFEFHVGIDVVLIGGRIFRHSMVALGPEAGLAFAKVKADLCLLGVTGLHPAHGLTTGDPGEAEIKQIMVEAAAETAVLVTADKIGQISPWRIAPLEALSTLVSHGDRPDWLPPSVHHVKV
ncbi:DeoR family transcriptional regulator [Tabrizicola sp. TH137]|uniref:DeoR/GlpR family DNA-binding transcription regulator n=1 Tax=Tabrizicola sp. TH137 TaxID=2067452 RepID=UPI000C7E623F|nr:DeoR/GlpR family DNA-binding transcription regulator [Tabrizicola sp. TH137]PLL10194.1 DeoR family transcriptional regulator [Tabrizicola sp. TH137]